MRQAGYQIKEIIASYKDTLRKLGIGVERVILYGSFAKGNQREDSDIDIIVVSRDFQKMNLRQRIEVLGIAAARIMQPIEALGYTPREIEVARPASFIKEISKIGFSVE